MRHEQILDRDSYTKVDVAAVWPVGGQIAPLPVPELAPEVHVAPTPSCADVPASVGGLIVASYAGLIAAFAVATVGSAHSWYMITISALFVVAFFTVPRIFLGIEPKQGARPDFDRFMAEGMQTLTGHSSGGAALVQMLIVPVSLTLGILAMAVAVSFAL
jgi:hypothetical protein